MQLWHTVWLVSLTKKLGAQLCVVPNPKYKRWICLQRKCKSLDRPTESQVPTSWTHLAEQRWGGQDWMSGREAKWRGLLKHIKLSLWKKWPTFCRWQPRTSEGFCLGLVMVSGSCFKLLALLWMTREGWDVCCIPFPLFVLSALLEFFSLPSSFAINNLFALMPSVTAAKLEFMRFTAPLTFHLGILRWFFRWKIIFFVLSFGQR